MELLKLGWVAWISSRFGRASDPLNPYHPNHTQPEFRAANTRRPDGVVLMAMVSRRALNRTGRRVILKPFVVLAARCLGPGPLRLQMVKLAHEMGDGQNFFEVFYGRERLQPRPAALEAPVQPSQRAA